MYLFILLCIYYYILCMHKYISIMYIYIFVLCMYVYMHVLCTYYSYQHIYISYILPLLKQFPGHKPHHHALPFPICLTLNTFPHSLYQITISTMLYYSCRVFRKLWIASRRLRTVFGFLVRRLNWKILGYSTVVAVRPVGQTDRHSLLLNCFTVILQDSAVRPSTPRPTPRQIAAPVRSITALYHLTSCN